MIDQSKMREPFLYFGADKNPLNPDINGLYTNATFCTKAKWVKHEVKTLQYIYYIVSRLILFNVFLY